MVPEKILILSACIEMLRIFTLSALFTVTSLEYGYLTTSVRNIDAITHSFPGSYTFPGSVATYRTVVVRGFLKITCNINGLEYFKCEYSITYYRLITNSFSRVSHSCLQFYTEVCEYDKIFYQACPYSDVCMRDRQGRSLECGYIVCDLRLSKLFPGKRRIISGGDTLDYFRCDGILDCLNTDKDEANCATTNVTVSCVHGVPRIMEE